MSTEHNVMTILFMLNVRISFDFRCFDFMKQIPPYINSATQNVAKKAHRQHGKNKVIIVLKIRDKKTTLNRLCLH